MAHLIGLGVEHRAQVEITDEERKTWEEHRGKVRTLAQGGYTVEEAMAVVRSDAWQWTPGFYKAK